MMAGLFALGALRGEYALSIRDEPTQYGARIEGTVSAIEKPYRVRLTDVHIDGKTQTKRDVIVSLMLEDGIEESGVELPLEPLVGQHVMGTGRLFAPDSARNPGSVDRRIQTICEGYELSGYLLPGWMAEGEARFSIGESFRCLRAMLSARISLLFGEHAALFQGMMLGERAGIDKEITAAMRLTGTVHILTVSGLHLTMIAWAVKRLLDRLPLGYRCRFAVLSVFLSLFAALIGFQAGTVRACIMAILREYAGLRGKQYEPLTGLSAAAFLMTLIKPVWLLSASFQFSFFVVLGIQLFAAGFTRMLDGGMHARGISRRTVSALAVSSSAQLASVPMQLLLYGYVPLLSLPMNMLCSSLTSLMMLGGWAVVLLSALSVRLAMWPARALCLAAVVFEEMSLFAAGLEFSILRLPAPYGISVLFFAGLMLLCSSRIRYGRWRRQAIALLVSLLVLCYLPRLNPQPRYVQLDVGQGDAALFRDRRRAVVVDVGPADSYELLRYLRHEGLFVDAVVLSHLDEDHAGALSVLLDSEVNIPAVICAQQAVSAEKRLSTDVLDALEKMRAEGIPLCEVSQGHRIASGRAMLDVLAPDIEVSGSNERSLLLHAQLADVSFLLTGDLPDSAEPEDVPDIDVLKVAHHGSKHATSDAFLAAARPELALISVGAGNRYGHPHPRVLESLSQVGADVLRTDESGCITLWLRDGAYRVETFVRPAACRH